MLHIPEDISGDLPTAAAQYAAAGWFIAPTDPDDIKHPGSILGSDWPTLTSCDEVQVAEWWTRYPNAGIALHVGRSGAVAFDIDRPEKMDDRMRSFISQQGEVYQLTDVNNLDRRHYLFAMPAGRRIGNSNGGLGATWGEIRGMNGVIIVEPTGHPRPDGQYRWGGGVGIDLPDLPAAIADALPDATMSVDGASERQVDEYLLTHTSGERMDLVTAWQAYYRRAIASGASRHQTMTAIMPQVMREVAAGLYPGPLAEQAMRQALIETIGTDRSPAVVAAEWRRIMSWAVAAAIGTEPRDTIARVESRGPGRLERWAATLPKYRPDDRGIGPPQTAQAGTDVSDEPPLVAPSWVPLDVGAIARGQLVAPVPDRLIRDDGAGLLYTGLVHDLHGESESGKSLIAQIECAENVKAQRAVCYIDFESSPQAVIERLCLMGCTAELLENYFTYIKPELSPYQGIELEAWETLLTREFTIVVLDGVTDALVQFGADSMSNDDIVKWHRYVPKRLAEKTGAAIVLVDHVIKSEDGRGRFAIGGQAKLAAIDGASYLVEVKKPIGRGMVGAIALRVAKDRPGAVRATCGPYRASDRTQAAATITIDSTQDYMVYDVCAPEKTMADEDIEIAADRLDRPTAAMEMVWTVIYEAAEAVSQRKIYAEMRNRGFKGRESVLKTALNVLNSEGYIRREAGARGAFLFTPTRPYRQADDPASDRYEPARTLDIDIDEDQE